MNIIVLIKQVPDTAEIKIDPKTGTLIREGVESIINPDDRHAIEVAVTLKQELGGKTTALSMGPPQAIDAVSEALGMGIDQGILLTDKNFAGRAIYRNPISFIDSNAVRCHLAIFLVDAHHAGAYHTGHTKLTGYNRSMGGCATLAG